MVPMRFRIAGTVALLLWLSASAGAQEVSERASAAMAMTGALMTWARDCGLDDGALMNAARRLIERVGTTPTRREELRQAMAVGGSQAIRLGPNANCADVRRRLDEMPGRFGTIDR